MSYSARWDTGAYDPATQPANRSIHHLHEQLWMIVNQQLHRGLCVPPDLFQVACHILLRCTLQFGPQFRALAARVRLYQPHDRIL
eukprot:1172574-Prorocentrum_minimum.AAC.1